MSNNSNSASSQSPNTSSCEVKIKFVLTNVLSTGCEISTALNQNPSSEIVQEVISHIKPIPAINYLAPNEYDNVGADEVMKQYQSTLESIKRFIRPRDQIIAFASILLKSMAFHETYRDYFGLKRYENERSEINGTIDGINNFTIPIVILPRTKNNKPYIPYQSPMIKDVIECSNILSISHQYPFVGLAYLTNPKYTMNTFHTFDIMIGIDIVTFDQPNPKLYSSIEEFINVFESSFTQREWNRIIFHNQPKKSTHINYSISIHHENRLLKEFYLRWAMKEAYTKAIGVGMMLQFHTFEINLIGVDDCYHDDKVMPFKLILNKIMNNNKTCSDKNTTSDVDGLWEQIMISQQNMNSNQKSDGEKIDDKKSHMVSKFVAEITHYGDRKSLSGNKTEEWSFIFIPLYCNTDGDGDGSYCVQSDMTINNAAADGCACICVGPNSRDTKENSKHENSTQKQISVHDITIECSSRTLGELVSYHDKNFKLSQAMVS